MEFLVKSGLTKADASKFRGQCQEKGVEGQCLTPECFSFAVFGKDDVVHGDEFYVDLAVEQGAKAGKVIKPKSKPKPSTTKEPDGEQAK